MNQFIILKGKLMKTIKPDGYANNTQKQEKILKKVNGINIII